MKVRVRVKTGAKFSIVEKGIDGSLTVKVHSPPVNGKANEELRSLLADYFKTTKDSVEIISGRNSRFKIVEIND